jgi:hypothetical protein
MRRLLPFFRCARRRLRRPVLRRWPGFSWRPIRWPRLRLRLLSRRPVRWLSLRLRLLNRRPILRLTLRLRLRRRRPVGRIYRLLTLLLAGPIERRRLIRCGSAIGRIRGACHDRGRSGWGSPGHYRRGHRGLRRAGDRDI